MKTVILAAVAAVALTACAAGTPTAETVTVTASETVTRDAAPEPEPEPAPQSESDDDLYIGLLASKGVYAGRSDSIQVGHMVCDALDDGYTGVDMVALAKASGFTTEQGAAIVAAAVLAYCPWNEGQATS